MNGQGNRQTKRDDPRSYAKEKLTRGQKKFVIFRLWRYLYDYKLLLLLAGIMVLASNLLALAGPDLSGKAIEAIGIEPGTADFPKVWYYVLLMLVFYVVSAILSYFLTIIINLISKNTISKMRRDVFERLTSLPVSFFDKHMTGDIISVISYDIDTVNSTLSTDFIQICKSAITIVGSFIMMVMIAPQLVLVFVITIPMSAIFTLTVTRQVRPLFKKRSAKLGEMNGFVEEMLSGQKTTRAYFRQKTVIDKFSVKNDEAVEAYTKSEYYGTINGPGVNLINNLSLALISIFGAILLLFGKLGLREISSFVLYSRKFSGPINEIANIAGDLQSAFSAGERIFRLIDEMPEKPDASTAKVLEGIYGNVAVENVDFGYEEDKKIIKGFDLDVKSGQMIAIVGPTGAGKTTIINLLMRFYDVWSGDIKVDGESIYNVTRDSLRKGYSMVLQDTWLFGGTIFENIAYGKENVTREEVENAAKAAKIHSYIKRLPDGYDTVLTDNGINISKGQKQLITIARAMLLDAKMLILDEATSNVDTETEMQIQESMRTLMRDKTCFVIAHRLSTVRHADKIIVLKDGGVVEMGTHDELMQKNGVYSELYYSQFENALEA